MNALTPSKLLLVGVSLLSLGACVAQASSPAPDDDGNGNNNGNKSGGGGLVTAGSNGSGGTPNNPGTGGTGNPGPGGMPQGTAGTTPVVTGGAPAGTGGGGALAACPSPPAAGAIADLLIDDLEDKDNGVAKVGGRSGFWYTYLDAYGSTIIPKPDATGAAPLVPGTTDCHGGTACVMVSGTTAAADTMTMKYPYAGVGFDFSNAKKPCVYNGSAYSGIKFWARGDAQIRVKVNTSATADASGGGTCTGSCNNGHGVDVVLMPTWTEVNLPFATIVPEPDWGPMPPPAFSNANLLSVQIQFPAGQTFSAAFDDFTFY